MKVGLIAMSGTPVHDPELRELIAESNSLQARLAAVSSLPSLALLTVAALLREKAEVRYLQCPAAGSFSCLKDDFDLVAISSYSAQIGEAYELADRYKQAGIPVVIGGTHASMRPGEVIDRGHIPAVGEAELVWPQIISDAANGNLKSRYGELGRVCDITRSPVPAFELLDPRLFPRVPVQTSRGCPHRC